MPNLKDKTDEAIKNLDNATKALRLAVNQIDAAAMALKRIMFHVKPEIKLVENKSNEPTGEQ